jgi:hypothetical protein
MVPRKSGRGRVEPVAEAVAIGTPGAAGGEAGVVVGDVVAEGAVKVVGSRDKVGGPNPTTVFDIASRRCDASLSC